MTPGLGFFYGGFINSANAINTIMMSIVAIPIICMQWFLFGYSITFAPNGSGSAIYGDLRWGALQGADNAVPNSVYAKTIPQLVFFLYQMMFAIIAPALISGAVVGRIPFTSYVIFILCWSTFVYDMIAHWVWSAAIDGSTVTYGWLRGMGVLDFGGGIVVHLTAGFSALVAAIVIGKRKEFRERKPLVPHNVFMTLLGTSLLWLGWFGFNGGNVYQADDVAAFAAVNTQLSASSATFMWMCLELIHDRRVSASQATIGAVVGLICSTPSSGYVEPWAAVIIGMIGAVMSFYSIKLRQHYFLYDDTLDVFSAHGVGGVVGPLCTGLFATKSVNPLGDNGAFYGNGRLLGVQLLGVVVGIGISVGFTAAILLVLKYTIGVRVSEEAEHAGLDTMTHGEAAYLFESKDADGRTVLSIFNLPKDLSTSLRRGNATAAATVQVAEFTVDTPLGNLAAKAEGGSRRLATMEEGGSGMAGVGTAFTSGGSGRFAAGGSGTLRTVMGGSRRLAGTGSATNLTTVAAEGGSIRGTLNVRTMDLHLVNEETSKHKGA